ncbi:cold-shock protein [Pelagovum pacificum]|uniref:Cold-shock protein n=1 Tax=Pelagovum pacificum TaxID=2588711 RepID=A0A5C5GG34_9RHOB|nr:cold shock domain-containing protein [Pelagovum pacificum]QQA43921.1 cold-shock protein [Pelagovum pacificum]TNY32949.1 cold-shock protein [Pelagovum pacificum]
MTHGIVKWFNDLKGFGLIKPDSGRDIFLHISDVEIAGIGLPGQGQKLKFSVMTDRFGRESASDLTLA